jgi:hypothetical protein
MTNEEFIEIISGGKLEHTEKQGWLYHDSTPRYVTDAVVFDLVYCWLAGLPKETQHSLNQRIMASFSGWDAVHSFAINAHASAKIGVYCKEILAMIGSGEINQPTQPQPSYRHSAPDQQS